MFSFSLRQSRGNALVASALLLGSLPSIGGELKFEGAEYLPVGKIPGDQTFPSVALGNSKGLVAWQDNTDGSGLAVRARLLGSQLSGISAPFYINSTFAGDQENVKVLALSNGGFVAVWQSGNRGAQQIFVRVLGPDGVFKTGEIQVSSGGVSHRNPAGCVLADGSVAIVWTALGLDGDGEAVAVARISGDGQILKPQVQVNVGAAFNQRDAAVALLENGSYVVAWVSEQQLQNRVASVFGRIYAADGNSASSELHLATGTNPCATPAVVPTPTGFLLLWNEYQLEDNPYGWDIKARPFGRTGAPSGSETLVNSQRKGDQLSLGAVRLGDNVVAVFSGPFLDGNGLGIGAQLLSVTGERSDSETVLNTSRVANQYLPAVAASSNGLALAVWSSFGSLETGVELNAQRIGLSAPDLQAPTRPYVTALSSSKLRVSWAPLDGLAVKKYHLYLDGSTAPTSSEQPFLTLSGLAPASAHSVQLAYELLDGRTSPLSEGALGTTWGEDDNADGLPDDWQAANFGANSNLWPAPSADSDGDGKTDREEFLTGTDPKSADSVLRTTLTQTAQGALLAWNAAVGGLYQVQYSADLVNWSDYQGIRVATEATVAVLIENVPQNSYFRVNYLR